jgi:hypothetical protein
MVAYSKDPDEFMPGTVQRFWTGAHLVPDDQVQRPAVQMMADLKQLARRSMRKSISGIPHPVTETSKPSTWRR